MTFQAGDKVRWTKDKYDLPWVVHHEYFAGLSEDDDFTYRVLIDGPYGARLSVIPEELEKRQE